MPKTKKLQSESWDTTATQLSSTKPVTGRIWAASNSDASLTAVVWDNDDSTYASSSRSNSPSAVSSSGMIFPNLAELIVDQQSFALSVFFMPVATAGGSVVTGVSVP